MSVDIVNINEHFIKKSVISLVEMVNDANLSGIDTGMVNFKHLDFNDSLLLTDGFSNLSIVGDKIDIVNIFPPNIDLQQFKQSWTNSNHTPEITENVQEEINNFNQLYPDLRLALIADETVIPEGIDVELAKDFILFCKVTGFYELNLTDVSITREGEKVTFSVVSTHPVYKGFIEVKA